MERDALFGDENEHEEDEFQFEPSDHGLEENVDSR
jgi:hypothetical protein